MMKIDILAQRKLEMTRLYFWSPFAISSETVTFKFWKAFHRHGNIWTSPRNSGTHRVYIPYP